jgi:hypothetical protein
VIITSTTHHRARPPSIPPPYTAPRYTTTMTTLWTFRGPVLLQTPLFTLRASARPFAIVAQQAFMNKLHPLHQRTTEKFLQRQTQLNIYTVVPLETSKHATVRDRIRRRLNEATRLGLVDLGYKADGTPIQKDGQGKDKEKLLGTLCFYPTLPVVSVKWEELRENVNLGLKKFMALKERDWEKERKTGLKITARDPEMNPRRPMKPPVEGQEDKWESTQQRRDQGGQRQSQGGQRQGQDGQRQRQGAQRQGQDGQRQRQSGQRQGQDGQRHRQDRQRKESGHREDRGGPRQSPQHRQDRQLRPNNSKVGERPNRATFSGSRGMI